LQIIHTWAEFARERDLQFFTAKHLEDIAKWADDALELLKEQEDIGTELTNAVELIRKKNERIEKLLKEQKAQKFFVDESGKITPLPVVVRCKDCRWWHESEIHKGFGDCGQANGIALKPSDWFCADGERKTACDGCEKKGGEDCALGKPGSENAYCPNGKLR
jgi:hypothetical protein